jgi:hypothetical protein
MLRRLPAAVRHALRRARKRRRRLRKKLARMSRCVKAAAVTMSNAESPQCTDEDVPDVPDASTMQTGPDALRDWVSILPKCDLLLPIAIGQGYVPSSRLSFLQTSTDIEAAPYIRRDFVGTALGTATEASRVQWPRYAACCRLWHGSGLCGDGSKEGAGVVDLFRRACFCRSEYGSFGFHVASTQRWAFLATDLSP